MDSKSRSRLWIVTIEWFKDTVETQDIHPFDNGKYHIKFCKQSHTVSVLYSFKNPQKYSTIFNRFDCDIILKPLTEAALYTWHEIPFDIQLKSEDTTKDDGTEEYIRDSGTTSECDQHTLLHSDQGYTEFSSIGHVVSREDPVSNTVSEPVDDFSDLRNGYKRIRSLEQELERVDEHLKKAKKSYTELYSKYIIY